MNKALAIFGAALALCVYSASAHAQATRTWVSGVGADTNPCSRDEPCQTFAGALSKTATGGEINCLDSAGFGTVSINKSITIDCAGSLGAILASGTTGVLVNDIANGSGQANVILRNMTINGNITGLHGINFISGRSLTLENVTIFGFNSAPAFGVRFAPAHPNAVLLVNNSSIRSNGIAPSTGGGIAIQPFGLSVNTLATVNNTIIQRNGGSGILVDATNASLIVTVSESRISNNTNGGVRSVGARSAITMIDRSTINSNSGFGVSVENAAATARVFGSVIHANAIGLQSLNGGVLRSYQNNAIDANGGGEGPFTQQNLK